MKNKLILFILNFLITILVKGQSISFLQSGELKLKDSSYFERRGLDILFYNNLYNGYFSDSKISGIEIIHHGVRTVTNGDVRLNSTPEQWDPVPQLLSRKVNSADNSIEAHLAYPEYHFDFTVRGEANDGGILLSVILEKPLPKELVGRAGFNLEFLPSAYFNKMYVMDGKSGLFPLYPSSSMTINKLGSIDPLPIVSGKTFVLAPEDPARRITIKAQNAELFLYDGRNKAQNGWYVVRTLIPADKSGKVVEWFLSANTLPNWIRKPVIAHSQLGYHPNQKKLAVIELDNNDTPLMTARLFKITEDGQLHEKYKDDAKVWGNYLRYRYLTFDFSSIKEEGLYILEYGEVRTKPFQISADIYGDAWHPTLDVYFPVAMDHMYVKEAYKVWHGASHLDDALQAPVNHDHFDLYAQGPLTDTPYKPGEHIPGLNVGGWYDAGDFDIRTQTIYATVLSMVQTWEAFGLKRDETAIDQKKRGVYIHKPDGKPDLLQQIEHGTLQLLAQHKSVGHAINGIIESHLTQYTHLGDASTKTDNLIYNPKLDSLQSDGFTSGSFDDRWAFTTKSTPLNYGSIAALAAASRALKSYNDTLSNECIRVAIKVWTEEHRHKPDIFYHGNTTGGQLDDEELKAAVELLISTKDPQYSKAIDGFLPEIEKQFGRFAGLALMALPYMNE